MDMSVGEVAKRAGVTVATLHFYEEKGLIYSSRNQANQRRYDRQILRRIAVIKAAQNVGLTLQEISAELEHLPKHKAPKKKEWEKLAQDWHQKLEEKIQSLRALQTQLGSCIQCGCLSLDSCALYNPDDSRGIKQAGAKLSHPES
ncbi:redox-sensitive transcriptional activator SoxR [Photobacterium alginatilyticum]|uniref:Redox-sensitive transcriptional activator SoxR n=1 Tax=Photobacterium alginatilyticum TaxID=1775171 RepID=A0ABW9YMP1_9GAMM|nr:redox-sensitive transcriptional activator SoxR [Photobacterium alginatilyticum]NBI55081.1 redox-sensitive transcriptional activator SoxR [Photobacterium alginatilyticum]